MVVLKRGDNNNYVRKLQERLKIFVDGDFGPQTERHVLKFQQSFGLVPDGIVGYNTWTLVLLHGYIPDFVLKQIPSIGEKFEINTHLRLAHFLAQCAHESIVFKAVEENLNYSAKGLHAIFRKYFPTLEEARKFERKPEQIANRVYSNRLGNGDEASGDGWKYRGRGYIQLTGKDNYSSFGNAIGVDLTVSPSLVAAEYPLLSAAWFFHKNRIHLIADLGPSEDTIKKVTRRVNGGYNGLEERIKFFNLYNNLLDLEN